MIDLRHTLLCMTSALWLSAGGLSLLGQGAVEVTLVADDATLEPGQTTTVRVLGQVSPTIESDGLRILTWYVDMLLEDVDGVLAVDWSSLRMSASDSPDGSSATSAVGVVAASGHLLGIHNTFAANPFQVPGPGVGTPVELLAFEVTATSTLGTAALSVAPGTGVVNLAHDFQVPKDGGGAYTGGLYPSPLSIEVSDTVVLPDPDQIQLTVEAESGGARVQFDTEGGFDYRIEFSDTLLPGSWMPLVGAPHNTGNILDTTAVGVLKRFYRVVIEEQTGQ